VAVTLARRRGISRRPAGLVTLPLFDLETVRHALETALPIRFSLESIPNDTLEDVRAKAGARAAQPAGYRAVALETGGGSLVP
jgi:hypothetical protein